jgi:hypothetical protein
MDNRFAQLGTTTIMSVITGDTGISVGTMAAVIHVYFALPASIPWVELVILVSTVRMASK